MTFTCARSRTTLRLRTAVAISFLLPFGSQAADAKGYAPKTFALTRAQDYPAEGIVSAPPARGSEDEKLELGYLRALIGSASSARMEQARADDAVEDPSIFDKAMAVDLKTLPATWALLRAVQNDADLAADILKVRFNRTRPWGVDPSLPNCDAGKGKKPTRSYPSGHATLGYSVGLMLADLTPTHAAAVLDRAHDYAMSREICGVHFPSDTEASHVLGTVIVERILTSAAAAPKIAAARAELASLASH